MKYGYFWLLLFISVLHGQHPSWTVEDKQEELNCFSKYILNRYYLVKCLKVPVEHIKKKYYINKKVFLASLVNLPNVSLKNEKSVNCWRKLKDGKGFEDFLFLLAQFLFFDAIECGEFQQDIVSMILHIYQTTIDKDSLVISHLKDANDSLAVHNSQKNIAIVFRFYFLKKIERAYNFLEKVNEKLLDINPMIQIDSFFKNSFIQSCFQEVVNSRNMNSFFKCYDHISHYNDLYDVSLYKEFLLFIFFLIQSVHGSSYKSLSSIMNQDSINAIENSIDALLNGYDIPIFKKRMGVAGLNINSSSFEHIITNELRIESQSNFIMYVWRRYYYINRLMLPTIESLFGYRSVMSPLMKNWTSFKKYSSLKSQLLIDHLSQEVFVLNEDDLGGISKNDAVMYKLIGNQVVDGVIRNEISDCRFFVSINKILLRFYHIKYLKPMVVFLKNHCSLKEIFLSNEELLNIKESALKDMSIDVPSEKQITVILDTFNKIKRYKHIDDVKYIYDYAFLIQKIFKLWKAKEKIVEKNIFMQINFFIGQLESFLKRSNKEEDK